MDPGAFRWLFGFVVPRRGRLAVVVAASLAASALSLAQPTLTRLVIDDGLVAHRLDLVAWYCLALVATALLGALVAAFNRWHYVTLSGGVLFALREEVFRHLLRLSPRFFARHAAGDILSRIDGDVAEIQRFAVDTLLAAVNGAIALTGTVLLMAQISPLLLGVALVALPAQVLALRLSRPAVERLSRGLRERSGAVTAFLVESLGLVKLVQAADGAARQSRRLEALDADYLAHLRRLEMTASAASGIPGLLGAGAAALVLLLGGQMVVDGRIGIGALVAFLAYLARAAGPLNSLLGLYLAQKRARISLERVMDILGTPAAVAEPAVPVALPPDARGEIRFDEVGFGYDTGGSPVLGGVSAVFGGGAKIGIIGVSGAGKTTLIDLLHRHYDPDRGRISLDGVDLRRLSLADLRRRIAVVAQDTLLVAGSIADNIRFAVPDADDAAIRRAAERSEVASFAEQWPDGLDTLVSERGTTLSGGQRQRLAIARALLQDPLVLVLDEATAAIDGEAERRLIATIDRLFAGRTRIVISHHADALAGVDATFELGRSGLVRRYPSLEPAA